MQRKKNKHAPSGYSLFTNCSFDSAKKKLDCHKGKDCMERFCKDIIEQAMKIIDDVDNKSYHKIRDHCH